MSTITRTRWQPDDLERLLEYLGQGITYDTIGDRLGRSRFAIEGVVRDLRSHRTHPAFWQSFQVAMSQREERIAGGAQSFRWTAEQDKLLEHLVRLKRSNAVIADKMGISRMAVKMRRFKLRDQHQEEKPDVFADDPVLALAVSGSWRKAA